MLHAYFETKVDKIILLQLINKKYQLLINKSSLLNTFIEAKTLIKNRYEKRK